MDILTPTKLNIVLDASKIDLFETCPQRYNYRHNLNKTLPMVNKAKALDLGSLAHNGLEVYFNGLKNGIHYDDRMQSTLNKISLLASDPDQSNSEPEEVSILMRAVEQSCDYWRSEDENCLEILEVEQPFIYELFSDNDIRIMISGKIDLLVNYHGIGRSSSYNGLVIDHKTYSRDSMLIRKTNQFVNYCNAVNSNYLLVNRIGLQNPDVKKPLSAEEKFKRLPLSYDPLYISSWKDNLIKLIMNEYLVCVGENYWPEKSTSCFKYNRLCEYYNICDMSGSREDKLIKLNNEYVDGEVWDVTKGLGD